MSKIDKKLKDMQNSPKNVRFSELAQLCEHYFGAPRQSSGSHMIYKTPWPGDPRINIQRTKDGMAKPYQVKQVIEAIEHLKTLLKDKVKEDETVKPEGSKS